jgi:hypothetical protein
VEKDVTKPNPQTFKILKKLRTDIRENVKIQSIKADIWLNYFKHLWSSKVDELIKAYSNNKSEDSISFGELTNVLKHSTKHLLKTVYRCSFLNMPERTSNIDTYFLNLIWQGKTPPEKWQKAIIVLLRKKGHIKKHENYRDQLIKLRL